MPSKTERSLKKNSKGVSPVISTIIIVSVAIVMSIAVAYWMLGIGASFTRFEKLEFTSPYTEMDPDGKYFTVFITVKNTGSASFSVEQVLLNGKPPEAYDVTIGKETVSTVTTNFTGVMLEPGQKTTGTISLRKGKVWGYDWMSGMTIEITILTSSGREYPKMITLP